MRNQYLSIIFRILYLVPLVLFNTSAWAQLTLPGGTNYYQDFDGIEAGLPSGWTVRTGATASSRGIAATFVSTKGTNRWSTTTGAFSNMASSEGLPSNATNTAQDNSTDRAIAIRQTGSFGDPGASFELAILNTVGMSNFSVSIKHLMLSVQGKSTTWSIQYSTNGGTVWVTAGEFPDPGTFGSTPSYYSLGSALDGLNTTVYIRIAALTVSVGSNFRDTYGIDDFELTWQNTTPPAITHTGTSPSPSNIFQGSTNNLLYKVQVDVATSAASLAQLVAQTGGTWTAGDITNFKLWYSTDAAFGGDALIATAASPAPGDVVFTVASQNFPVGTSYLFITCDVGSAAGVGKTVSIQADSDDDFTYNTTPTYSGSTFTAGNAMTIAGVPEIQLEHPVNVNVSCGFQLNFGTVNIGSSNSLTVRIRNIGSADLLLTALPLQITGAQAAHFTITTQPFSPIPGGSFSDAVIQFAPSAAGALNASVSMANNDSNENPCVIQLTGAGALANDNCSGAAALTVSGTPACGAATNGTTVGATSSGLPPLTCNNFNGDADDDVWYAFVATNSRHTITVACGSGFDGVVDLRAGTCNGTSIACADENVSGFPEIINATGLDPGVTYFVRIYSYGTGQSKQGNFTICITTPPPRYFRSKQSGAWHLSSTWEWSEDNITWINSGAMPGISDHAVSIRAGHTVTISSTVALDETTIENGGVLIHSGGTMTVNNGTGTDLTIQSGGKLSLPAASVFPVLSPDAELQVQTNGIITVNAEGIIENLQYSGFVYAHESILEYAHNTAPSFSGVTFFPYTAAATIPVLKITNTLGNAGGSNPTVVNGRLEVISGASVSWSGTGAKTFRNGITGEGSVHQGAAGPFIISGDAGSIAPAILNLGSNGLLLSGTSTVNLAGDETVQGGGITVASGGVLNCGEFSLSGNTNFSLSAGAVLLTASPAGLPGAIAVTGTKTFSSSAGYEFRGGCTGVFLTAPAANTVGNLTVNNLVGDVDLDMDLTVTGVLNLAAGRLDLGGFHLTLAGTLAGPAFGSNADNYVIADGNGTFRRNAGLFPVGTSLAYMPCEITGGVGPYYVNIQVPMPGLSPEDILDNQWNITNGGEWPDISFQWPASEENTGFPASGMINLYRFVAGWSVAGAAPVPSGFPRTVTFQDVECCSGYTVGAASALPVELVTFKAEPAQDKVRLYWETFSEINHDYFSVEKSLDGTSFYELGTIRGTGDSFNKKSYSYIDPVPVAGVNYYRLKQVDYDGRQSKSPVVSVKFSAETACRVFPAFPTDHVTIQFPEKPGAVRTVTLIDSSGRILRQWMVEPGERQQQISTGGLLPGSYFLRIETGHTAETLRFFKL